MRKRLTRAGGLFLAAALASLCGCSKNEPTEPSSTETVRETKTTESPSVPAVILQASNSAAKALTETKAAVTEQKAPAGQIATQAVATLQAAGSNLTQAASTLQAAGTNLTSQAQTLIQQAKTMVTNKQYSEAFTTLQKLSSTQLTPEQQQTVADLKTQVQKALATTGLTNFLGGRR